MKKRYLPQNGQIPFSDRGQAPAILQEATAITVITLKIFSLSRLMACSSCLTGVHHLAVGTHDHVARLKPD